MIVWDRNKLITLLKDTRKLHLWKTALMSDQRNKSNLSLNTSPYFRN
jgi:hypothetical protein